MPLVRAVASRLHGTLPAHVDMDDLVHSGILGLIDAADKFDDARGVPFGAYANQRIKGSILDSLRQYDWASRDMRRKYKRIEANRRGIASELGREATDAEVAARSGLDEAGWRRAVVELQSVGLTPLSIECSVAEDIQTIDPPSLSASPDQIATAEELKTILAKALGTLPPRYQRAVALYYVEELSMREIGTIIGVNESRVSQIIKMSREKLAAVLEAAGIASIGDFFGSRSKIKKENVNEQHTNYDGNLPGMRTQTARA